MTELVWRQEFSRNLRAIMREQRMNQRELSYETGISEAMISMYLNGRRTPSVPALVNLIYALQCRAEDLIYFCDEPFYDLLDRSRR